MNRVAAEVLDYYDKEVSNMIHEKYGYSHLKAIELFVTSETHEMLEDLDCGLTFFGAPGIFELWEAERITGDPRNSAYIREE